MQVGVSNSLKIFAITNVPEKFCQVSVPVGSIILLQKDLTHCLHNKKTTHEKDAKSNQGITDMNRNGNSAIFLSYVYNSKKIKELFASTLNRIAASVRCLSSMIVVLNAKLPD